MDNLVGEPLAGTGFRINPVKTEPEMGIFDGKQNSPLDENVGQSDLLPTTNLKSKRDNLSIENAQKPVHVDIHAAVDNGVHSDDNGSQILPKIKINSN